MAMPIAAAGPSHVMPLEPVAPPGVCANMGSADNIIAVARNASLFVICLLLLQFKAR
jgi:hypothetical protein